MAVKFKVAEVLPEESKYFNAKTLLKLVQSISRESITDRQSLHS